LRIDIDCSRRTILLVSGRKWPLERDDFQLILGSHFVGQMEQFGDIVAKFDFLIPSHCHWALVAGIFPTRWPELEEVLEAQIVVAVAGTVVVLVGSRPVLGILVGPADLGVELVVDQ